MDNVEHIREWLGTGSINLFGRPFAGKDTQGERLTTLFNGKLLGGGDILRHSTIPPHVLEAMNLGELIPSEDYVAIVLPYLERDEWHNRPLILSAVGRWHGEERGVIEATAEAGHTLKAVIYIDIDELEVHKRWQALKKQDNRDRPDDALEVLENRLKIFRDKTLPVLETYQTLGLLVSIDGMGSSEEVQQRIITELNKLRLIEA